MRAVAAGHDPAAGERQPGRDPRDRRRGGPCARLPFQAWWIKHRAALPASAITLVHHGHLLPAPGVLEAIEAADVVLLPPSNPVVSIGTILQVKGIREAIADKRVVGVSPIIGGSPVRGMADACLDAIGVETSAEAVGRHYGAELLDGWLVDSTDAGVTVPGWRCAPYPFS